MILPDTIGIEAKKSGYSPLPAGEYLGIISKIEEGASQKGTPLIQFEIDITTGEYAGRKVWKKVYLAGADDEKTKMALGMYAGVLESLGMTQDQRHATKTIEQLREFALRLNVEMYVSQREYNGKIYNDVDMEYLENKPF